MNLEISTNEKSKRIFKSGKVLNNKNATPIKEIPSIRLSPEQIEEIHTDEYSLVLFYATRVEALSLPELKRDFPEPQSGRAQAVMERFRAVGLNHLTADGKYFSNFPDNYINYSDYRYDGDLEAKKDAKVFGTMKEFTGKREFWKDKTYFSIDGFFTKDQNDEILKMFNEIRLKTKQFSNDNTSIKNGQTEFRRLKFYHMPWMLAFLICFSFLSANNSAFAKSGGNDPGGLVMNPIAVSGVGGGGNDPSGMFAKIEINNNHLITWRKNTLVGSGIGNGGGGHDPNGNGTNFICGAVLNGVKLTGDRTNLCKVTTLVQLYSKCETLGETICNVTAETLENTINQLDAE